MNTLERVMRGMTHLNIGATLALLAWALGHGAIPTPSAPAVVSSPAASSLNVVRQQEVRR